MAGMQLPNSMLGLWAYVVTHMIPSSQLYKFLQ